MCFSANASFLVGGGIAVLGIVTLKKAKRHERLLAAMPLLFGIQQLIEGFQWLSQHPGTVSLVLGYAYLFFAFLLWPAYIPLAIYQLEHHPFRKRILKALIASGLLATASLVFVLKTQPLSVCVLPEGLAYSVDVPFPWYSAVWYVMVVCGSFLVASNRFIRLYGLLLAGSVVLAWMVFQETFTSVWCFFAAGLSMLISLFFLKRWNGKCGSATLNTKDALPTKAK